MIVVYTVVTNDYDDLKRVEQEDGVVYIALTDNMSINPNGWFLWETSHHNRWVKFHARRLFPSVEYTIYLDAHAELTIHPKEIVNSMGDSSVGCQPHPVRDCVYEEISTVVALDLENKIVADKLVKEYKKVDYPRHNGLFCNGCIVRKNDKKSKYWEETCYSVFFNEKASRDQIITPLVTHVMGLNIKPIKYMFKWSRHKKKAKWES